jgi:hypothetical protein
MVTIRTAALRSLSRLPTSGATPHILRALAILAYVVLLHWTYVSFVAPTFGYQNMGYRTPVGWMYVLMIAAVVALGLIHPGAIRKPSDAVVWLLFLLTTAPTMLVPQLTPFLPSGLAFRFGVAVGTGWLCVLVLLRWGSTRRVFVPAPLLRLRAHSSERVWVGGLLLIALSAAIVTLLLPGVAYRVVGFGDVQKVRIQYRLAIAAIPAFVPYLLLNAVYVVNPTLIAYGWMRRKWWLLAIGCAGQVLNYSVTGYKTVALSVVAVVMVAWVLQRLPTVPGTGFAMVIVVGMAFALAAFLAVGYASAATYFTTRSMIVPGNVAAAHVFLFSSMDPLYWSQAFMGRFIHYPFSAQPAYIVGYFLSGSRDNDANVNMFGDGYISARYAGIALECLILTILLLVLDRASEGKAPQLVLPIMLGPAFLLANVNVFTSLLTSGFALAIVVIFFAPDRAAGEDHALTEIVESGR